MKFEKIDSLLFAFFQRFADTARKVSIPLTVLVNAFLAIQIIAQVLQVYFLQKAGHSVGATLLLAFPTLIITLILYYMVKVSRKRPVIMDLIRTFGFLFALITMFSFTLGILSGKYRPGDNKFYAEIAYQIAYIAFPCFLYLLSCSEMKMVNNNNKLNA